MKRRGLEPIRLEPSHSWTQNEVIVVPSTERIEQILKRKKYQGFKKGATNESDVPKHYGMIIDSLTVSHSKPTERIIDQFLALLFE